MATAEVFVTGHGGFKDKWGFTAVRPKMEVCLYRELGENMPSATVRDWLMRAQVDLNRLGGEKPTATVGSGTSMRNLLIGPLRTEFEKRADLQRFEIGKGVYSGADPSLKVFLLQPRTKIHIADVMDRLRTHPKLTLFDVVRLHWLACLADVQHPPAAPSSSAPPPPAAVHDDPFAGIELVTF